MLMPYKFRYRSIMMHSSFWCYSLPYHYTSLFIVLLFYVHTCLHVDTKYPFNFVAISLNYNIVKLYNFVILILFFWDTRTIHLLDFFVPTNLTGVILMHIGIVHFWYGLMYTINILIILAFFLKKGKEKCL